MTAHWGIADPAAVQGSDDERRRAFSRAFRELDTRIQLFTSLPVDRLDRAAVKRELDRIGEVSRRTT
jgi:arsenate reductase